MRRSKITAFVSDVHFDDHDPPTWRAFRAWHAHVRPHRTVLAGDMIDFGMLSNYAQHANAQDKAIPQIRMFVAEANALALEAGQVTFIEGNHDERWARLVGGPLGSRLRGAIGLSLEEQCRFQGLDKRVIWRREDVEVRGVAINNMLARHGHNQSSKYGVKHIAAAMLAKNPHDSQINGHTHRVQMMCHTSGWKTVVAISNGNMASDQHYQLDPNWQRSFIVVEACDDWTTAYPVLIDKGRFALGGRVFDGNDPKLPGPPRFSAPNITPPLVQPGEIDVDLSELDAGPPPGVVRHLLTAFGRTQCLADWRRETGVSERTIRRRLAQGKSNEEAVSRGTGAARDESGRFGASTERRETLQ